MSRGRSSNFGLLLRRHRRAAGLTQEELAEKSGLSVRAISDLERSVRHPRRETAQLLFDALQLPPSEQVRFDAAVRGAALPPSAPERSSGQPQPGGFLGALPQGSLVGRQTEMQRVRAVLDAVADGSGRLIMIAGEPGVGKTRLAQEVAREAAARGFSVATGRSYEQDRGVPFHPFLEALPTLFSLAPEVVREESPLRWPHLARLIPALGTAAQDADSNREEDQYRLFQAVSEFVRVAAGETPVAILLDDVQCADSASLKLFMYLTRHTRSHRILLLGAYREIEVGSRDALDRALVDLNREGLVERITLHRLTSPETEQLITSTLGSLDRSSELARLVHDATDGNAFFIQEVLRALIERGNIYQDGGRWQLCDLQEIQVPETVHSAVAERLSRLYPGAQEVLREASILGQTFTFDDLWCLSSQPEEEIEKALDGAVQGWLIRETGNETYAFIHALAHQVLYRQVSARRRRRLHRAAGEALERLPSRAQEQRVADLSRHFLEANEPERAIRYTSAAGDRAMDACAYGEAERYYRTAIDVADHTLVMDVPASLRAELLSKLGRVFNTTERYDLALQTLEQAATLFHDGGDVPREGQVVAEIGWIHRARGTVEEGIDRIQPFIATLEAADLPPSGAFTLAGLYTALARLFFRLGLFGQEVVAAERASQFARGNDLALCAAEVLRGQALMTLGKRKVAREVLQGAVDLSRGCHHFGLMSLALEHLGEIARDGGDFEASKAYLVDAVAAAEQRHVPSRIAWTTAKLGHIAFLLGAWEEAAAHFERAGEIFASIEPAKRSTFGALFSAPLLLARGEWARAEATLATVMAIADPRRDLWIVRHAQVLLAERDLLSEVPEAALARLEPLLDRPGLEETQVTSLLQLLARANLELERVSEAEEIVRRGLARAEVQSDRFTAGGLMVIEGLVRARQGRWAEAHLSFQGALSLLRSMPYPYGEAQALYEYGRMYAVRGETDAAIRSIRDALAIFHRLGARPYIERAEEALVELAGPHGSGNYKCPPRTA